MKKYLAVLALAVYIIPSIALASWYNPFSWNWKALFNSPVQTETQNSITATSTISTSTAPNNFEPLTQEQMASMAKKASVIKSSTSTPVVSSAPNILPISVQCYVDNISITTGQSVTWSAQVSGGNGVYSYFWSGNDGLFSTSSLFTLTYNTAGKKTAYVIVSSGGQSQSANCNDSVTVLGPAVSSTLCNGTYYSACGTNQTFVCPQSGGAYCQNPQSKTADQVQSVIDSYNQQEKDRVARETQKQNSPECQQATNAYNTIEAQLKPLQDKQNAYTDNYDMTGKYQSLSLSEESQLTSLDLRASDLWHKKETACDIYYSPSTPRIYNTDCQLSGNSASCTTF